MSLVLEKGLRPLDVIMRVLLIFPFRWGPNAKEMAAIKKYLETQNVTIRPNNHPLVGGVEVDLPALYHAVQSFGGLTEVIQRKKWPKIADFLRIPKGTQV